MDLQQNNQTTEDKPDPYLRIPNYFGKNIPGIKTEFLPHKKTTFKELNVPQRVWPMNSMLLIGGLNIAFTGLLLIVLNQKTLSKKNSVTEIAILVFLYVVYVTVALLFEDVSAFSKNMKRPSEYHKLFEGMKSTDCYLKFKIKCFHYKKTGKSKRQVVTHTARQEFRFAQVTDNSGVLKEIKDNGGIFFMRHVKRFSIPNPNLLKEVVAKFNQFVYDNIQDRHQKYSMVLEIPDFQEKVCYAHSMPPIPIEAQYQICAVLGLALPYLLVLEWMIKRYEVKIHKIMGN